jgi:hypothetical protein
MKKTRKKLTLGAEGEGYPSMSDNDREVLNVYDCCC